MRLSKGLTYFHSNLHFLHKQTPRQPTGNTLDSSTETTTTEDELIRVLAAVFRLPGYAKRVMTEMQMVAVTDIITGN